MRGFLVLFFLFTVLCMVGQNRYSIKGYVKDASNGESLIGATVFVKEISGGNVTNVYGFYSLTLPAGNYSLTFRYVGFDDQTFEVDLDKDQTLDVNLMESTEELQEVVVAAEAENANVSNVEMSTNTLNISSIKKLPAFLGEVDVIKSIQLLPGVSSVGEGSAGFNVRGGGVGQNLVLLDEAPVYNTSHLLGFFSVFNPDAVKDIKLYKGGIPPKFGGRLSSILDIRMKEGNANELEINGGIGTVFSRLAVEGPLIPERSSFIIAGRRSYADVLAKPFTDVLDDGAALNFYDLTLKTNYNFSDRDRLYLSGYFGRDVFRFDARQGFNWGNRTGTLRWNHLFSDRLFSNFSLIYSDYEYSLAFGENDRDKFEWDSDINTVSFKPEFTYFIDTRNELTFGGEFTRYTFEPANAIGVSNGDVVDISVPEKRAAELAIHVGNEQKITSWLSLQYGVRYSQYANLGPGLKYFFGDTIPGARKPLTSTTEFGDNDVIKYYSNLEPRFAARFQLNEFSSIKASYNRMAQYLHLISNTTASNPLDLWTPSSNNLRPQLGDAYAIGYFRNFNNNKIETSLELYYRETQNQVEYIDGAEILINELIEGDLLSGIGRAYGMEVYLKKNEGRLNGWISYTLARSELKTVGINNGDWYPTRFDQTHNLKIASFYEIDKQWSVSTNFSYITGTPTTFPTSRYEVQGLVIPHNTGNTRNNVRIPAYHRLDLSFTRLGNRFKKDGSERKNRDSLVLTIYNLYNRRNAFSIYFAQEDQRFSEGEPITTQASQVSIFGSIIPSITYNFNF